MRDYTALMERAQSEEIGLAVKTNNTGGLQVNFCNFIRENPQFKDLMFCIPSLPDQVWIVKKSVELPE